MSYPKESVKLNSRLALLQPYPVEKLAQLFAGEKANTALSPINLSVGEPKHYVPECVQEELNSGLDALAYYPTTKGKYELREVIADWLTQRHQLSKLDPDTQVLPTQGSREALFALTQIIADDVTSKGAVGEGLALCPNPFYQIYEGASLLAGLRPYFMNTLASNHYRITWSNIPVSVWKKVQLVFICTPGNPCGGVMSLDEWELLFQLSDKYGFIIVSDECYGEIYCDENKPPLGSLEAAERLGRSDFKNLVALGSLSKRSNVPGLRSGFAAGDARIMKAFTQYRTYHGSAMGGLVQDISARLWQDESHVQENRRLYQEKFDLFYRIISPVLPVTKPEASFYYWLDVGMSDLDFAVQLRREENITVLPGSMLSKAVNGINPGDGYVRIALVSTVEETLEAAHRIRRFIEKRRSEYVFPQADRELCVV